MTCFAFYNETQALNSEQDEVLIDAEGKLQPRMNEKMQFLQYFQNEFVRTELLARHLEGLGLFVPQGACFAPPADSPS
ncbi:MAG: hypothetical protein PHP05_05915 [Sideroxydans sp.]|nr:hypothetical protein [Sideroxydans sp.]